MDPYDFVTPLDETPQASLRRCRTEQLHKRWGQLSLATLREVGQHAPPPELVSPRKSKSRVKRSTLNGETDEASIAKRVGIDLDVGLTGPRQTNSALMAAALAFAPLHNSEQTLQDKVIEWFESHHNGHSQTLNAHGWGAIANEAAQCVAWAWARRDRGPLAGLSAAEAARHHVLALSMTSGPSATVPEADLYRLELLLAEITVGAKAWVMRQCLGRLETIRVRDAATADDESKVTAQLVTALSDIWPDPRTGFFVVPMPWAFRLQLSGFSASTMVRLFRALQERGVVRLMHEACATAGLAARYLVELDFSDLGLRHPPQKSLPAMLNLLLSAEHRREVYSKHYAADIRIRGEAEAQSLFGDDSELVRAVLAHGGCWRCATASVRTQASERAA
jgi:hypothetical protein